MFNALILAASLVSQLSTPVCVAPASPDEVWEGHTNVCQEWEVMLGCDGAPVVACYDWGNDSEDFTVFRSFTLETQVKDGAVRVVAVVGY